jgi:hypothetical protein
VHLLPPLFPRVQAAQDGLPCHPHRRHTRIHDHTACLSLAAAHPTAGSASLQVCILSKHSTACNPRSGRRSSTAPMLAPSPRPTAASCRRPPARLLVGPAAGTLYRASPTKLGEGAHGIPTVETTSTTTLTSSAMLSSNLFARMHHLPLLSRPLRRQAFASQVSSRLTQYFILIHTDRQRLRDTTAHP